MLIKIEITAIFNFWLRMTFRKWITDAEMVIDALVAALYTVETSLLLLADAASTSYSFIWVSTCISRCLSQRTELVMSDLEHISSG